jgi:hypothetical protein
MTWIPPIRSRRAGAALIAAPLALLLPGAAQAAELQSFTGGSATTMKQVVVSP